MTSRCEFCGKEYDDNDIADGTSFHGAYCRECLEICIYESKTRLNELKKRSKKRLPKVSKESAKLEMEKALHDLLRGPDMD